MGADHFGTHANIRMYKEMPQMAEGTIKKLCDKGFGFITTGSKQDVFFHCTNVECVDFTDLYVGQKVIFTEGQGPKGPCAGNVRPA